MIKNFIYLHVLHRNLHAGHRTKLQNRIVMTSNVLKITYTTYSSLGELQAEDRELAESAIKAIGGSYAPYSKFNVGAAVRLSDGEIITGANQENAAYPSGLCAERTAMFYANASHPGCAMTSIAIAASQGGKLCSEPATPCGQCRQVMAEYQSNGGRPMSIILVGSSRIYKFDSVECILPFIFDSLDPEKQPQATE